MPMSATAVQQVAHEHAGAPAPTPTQGVSRASGERSPSGTSGPTQGDPGRMTGTDQDPAGPSQRNRPPTNGVTIGDLLNGSHEFREDTSGQHEDQPGNVAADEDSLELVRKAYNNGVRDTEQLLRLAENAQPTPPRDAPFSVQARFGGSLQNLTRPKIIANLKLIDDNPVIRELLDKHAIVHVHKLPRNQLMFYVDSKKTKKKLGFLGKKLEFEVCDPLSDNYSIDIMGVRSQTTARTVFHALVIMGCKPIYYNATFISGETQVSPGILRYYLASNACPPSLLVNGSVCSQFLMDGALYAVKGRDAPPQHYHLQPSKMAPNCLDLSKLPFEDRRHNALNAAKQRSKAPKQTGEKRGRDRDVAAPVAPTPLVTDEVMRSVETEDPNLSPVEHASEHDGNPLDLSLDVNMDSDVSQPTTPTVDFPSDAFAHPPKCLQSRRTGPPPTASSQSWNSPNFWSHLEGLDPELECLETNPAENGDSGYQIVVTRISPSDESVNSNEYGYYHEKKKSKVQLSTNPVTVREWIPVMAESISKSKQLFQEEQKETLSTDINSEAIMKEINKNRLAFLIKVSRWMHQKSELVEELPRVHLWFRYVHSSVANGNKFPTKWKKLTGFAAPSSRPALFKRTAEMLVSMSDEAKLYDTSLALALFELMLIAATPGIFNNDYWIQTLAKTHVPWIQTSEGRLLHPNVLIALLRTECGETILTRMLTSGWEHSIMYTLTQFRDGQSWLTEEAAMLQMQVRDGHLLLAAGPLHIEC